MLWFAPYKMQFDKDFKFNTQVLRFRLYIRAIFKDEMKCFIVLSAGKNADKVTKT